jgi:hypothetical protein
MRMYWVKVAIPTYYHIAAESKRHAADEVSEQYKYEHNTAEDPQVLEVVEIDKDDELVEIVDQSLSRLDEARYLLKRW